MGQPDTPRLYPSGREFKNLEVTNYDLAISNDAHIYCERIEEAEFTRFGGYEEIAAIAFMRKVAKKKDTLSKTALKR